MQRIKARVNKDGLMGSKTRVHRTKKGKGSYSRKELRKKMIDTLNQF
jgi:stalled ribosome alternative rescue factor ArfA